MEKYQYSDSFSIEKEVRVDDDYCYGSLFADDDVLCAPTNGKLNKSLSIVNGWTSPFRIDGLNKWTSFILLYYFSRVIHLLSAKCVRFTSKIL
ncbi:hypothetical protein BCR32DRAFT_274767 [Anaeromyces robustus]|uniref:Uncharacterized protein n=1 Tax=Anaeromyces robustus TaxID=1754192 RepID=A0A1Y1XN92_9FUNG|nr:hypothetical protein BCR32DRAFT_274767 [Anaeromyces robustus]|eukprot:ORX87135.1 hypothetical protein BCR32DRAFT_274767 [Anaeromyces robustus]